MPPHPYYDYVDMMGPKNILPRCDGRFRLYVGDRCLGEFDKIGPAKMVPVEVKTASTEVIRNKNPGAVDFILQVPKSAARGWMRLLDQMHGRAAREEPEQEKEMPREKADTYYERELWPLKLRALSVQSRHEHAIKKYHNDRSTHDGSMVVKRPLVVTMLEAIANRMRAAKVRNIAGCKWNLHTVYMETTYDLPRSANESNGELLYPSTEPTVRVPATLVVELVTLYQHHVVQQRDFPKGSDKGLPERLPMSSTNKNGRTYKRTTTKPSQVDVDY